MTLSDRLSAALKRRRPEIGHTSWYAKHATDKDLDCDPDTLKRWTEGRTEPGGEALLALFDHFGEEFEAEVRGRVVERTCDQHLDAAAYHVAEAQRKRRS